MTIITETAGNSSFRGTQIPSPFSALGTFFRRMRNRQTLETLYTLDDHLLEDIGLSRNDLDKALEMRGHFDPMAVLMGLARAR